MTSRARWLSLPAVLAIAALLGAAGCGDDTVLQAPAAATTAQGERPEIEVVTRFSGQVRELQTGLPIAGASVRICGFEEEATTTAADGRFVIDLEDLILPIPGEVHPFQPAPTDGQPEPTKVSSLSFEIERTGYATLRLQVGTEAIVDLVDDVLEEFFEGGSSVALPRIIVPIGVGGGSILMRRGEEAHVVVTLDGLPIGKDVAVTAVLLGGLLELGDLGGLGGLGGSGSGGLDLGGLGLGSLGSLLGGSGDGAGTSGSGCPVIIAGTTDVNGVATLENLDPLGAYLVLVPPQDLDGQPGYDIFPFPEAVGFPADFDDFDLSDLTFDQVIGLLGGLGIMVYNSTLLGDPIVLTVRSTPLPLGLGSPILSTSAVPFPGPLSALATDFRFSFPTGPIKEGDYGSSALPRIVTLATGAVDEDEEVTFSRAVTSSTGAVTVVLLLPATVVPGSPRFEYRNNLADPVTSTAYDPSPRLTSITATAVDALPVAAPGLVWRFTPTSTATLPANEVVTLRFAVLTEGSLPILPEVSEKEVTFYRPKLGLTLADPTADNYNGTTVTPTSVTAPAYIEFDEVVTGAFSVREVRIGNVTHSFGAPDLIPFPRPDPDGLIPPDSMVFNVGPLPSLGEVGAVTGTARFRLQLIAPGPSVASDGTGTLFQEGQPIALPDSDPSSEVTVTVEVAVRDAEGNRLDKVLTLPVR